MARNGSINEQGMPLGGDVPPGGAIHSHENLEHLLLSLHQLRALEGSVGAYVGLAPEVVVETLTQILPHAEPWADPTDMVGYCSRAARLVVESRAFQELISRGASEILLDEYVSGILSGLYSSSTTARLDLVADYLRPAAAQVSTLGQIHGAIIRFLWQSRHSHRYRTK